MVEHSDILSSVPHADRAFARDLAVPEHWRVACLAHDSLMELGMPRVNVLLVGAEEVVWRVLASALNLASPVASWRPGEPMHLPESAAVRTLIVREAGDMSGAEQIRLLEWLERVGGRTQVICTSSGSLIALVEQGRFIDSLYYRLNTICLDLRPVSAD